MSIDEAAAGHLVAGTLDVDYGKQGGTTLQSAKSNLLITGAVSAKWAKQSGGPAGDEAYNLIVSEQAPPLTGNHYGDHESREGLLVAKEPAVAFSSKDAGQDAGEVSPTLRAMPHDESHPNGGGQVAVALSTEQEPKVSTEVAPTLKQPSPSGGGQPLAVAFDARQSDVHVYGEKAGALDCQQPQQGVSVLEVRGRGDGRNLEMRDDGTANALRTPTGGRDGMGVGAIHAGTIVRRITPLEAERLQGLPDEWTNVPYRGKPMADGPRYRLIGNGIAINVLSYIGQRIDLFRRVTGEE